MKKTSTNFVPKCSHYDRLMMISGTIELSGLLLTVVVAVAWADLPYNYLSLSAKAKQAVQWDQITASVRPANALPDVYPPPDVDPSTMFDPNFLVTSFLWGSDEVPPGRRKSLVAPYAAIAKIVFKTRPDSNFTGLFQSGGIGLLRIGLSAAQEGTSASNFVLTFAAKIYIDGAKSENFLMVHDVDGQFSNHNVFFNNISNWICCSTSPLDVPFQNTIPLISSDPTMRPRDNSTLGLAEQASITSDGNPVAGPLVVPFEATWVPNPAVSTPMNSTNDFRLDLAAAVNPGDLLYNVVGRRTPNSTVWEPIGQVFADSQFVASVYGDMSLFFQHPALPWRA